MGGVRLRAARPRATTRSSPTTTRARRSGRRASRRSGCSSRRSKKVTLASTTPWTIVDATGAKTALDAGQLTLDSTLTVDGAALEPPLKITAKAPLSVAGTAYRGKLTVTLDGKLRRRHRHGRARAVPEGRRARPRCRRSGRPPRSKAQAVAARSYALANLTKGRAYDLYGDARSQVYGGIAAESDSASAAVDATKGQVVLYSGKVANTLFFSTSGGRTVSALEATGVDVPYLVSVADPYDTLSPYHDWGPVLYDAKAVAKQLKLSGSIASSSVRRAPRAACKSLVAVVGRRHAGDAHRQPAAERTRPSVDVVRAGAAAALAGRAHDHLRRRALAARARPRRDGACRSRRSRPAARGPTPGRCPSTRTGRSRSSSSRRSRRSTGSPGAMRARVSRRSPLPRACRRS